MAVGHEPTLISSPVLARASRGDALVRDAAGPLVVSGEHGCPGAEAVRRRHVPRHVPGVLRAVPPAGGEHPGRVDPGSHCTRPPATGVGSSLSNHFIPLGSTRSHVVPRRPMPFDIVSFHPMSSRPTYPFDHGRNNAGRGIRGVEGGGGGRLRGVAQGDALGRVLAWTVGSLRDILASPVVSADRGSSPDARWRWVGSGGRFRP